MNDLTTSELQALREELARAEIRNALFRYCRGVDRADKNLILSAFHPGAQDNHGSYTGAIEDFADILVRMLSTKVFDAYHSLGNMFVTFDGDAANVETYFLSVHRERQVPDKLFMFGGRYLDRFEKRRGGWLIARRTVVNDWSCDPPLPADAAIDATYARGTQDRFDPVLLADTWQGRDWG